MSTVLEIESAIEQLSSVKMLEIYEWLDERVRREQRPDGYFASAYTDYPQERADLEAAFSKIPQNSER